MKNNSILLSDLGFVLKMIPLFFMIVFNMYIKSNKTEKKYVSVKKVNYIAVTGLKSK